MSETAKLRYDEGCLAAQALNVVGDRWALLVVREMMFTPKRFQAIRAGIPGITASVLTARLEQLADLGVVSRDARLGIYALTAAGQALLPVLQALCRWGAADPGHDPRRFISPTALMISMTEMIDRGAARGMQVTAGFDMGAEAFVQHLTGDGTLRVEAVAEPMGDFVLSGTGNQIAAAVYGTASPALLRDGGIIGLTGDAEAAQRFVTLFALLPPHRKETT